ncbi:hypothetical protein BV25DRAFT_1906569 [Artomyces pyxidatus]|uniref:Uncharacterized protein n=1 Tax=Artomyces pyxidatus TaxID=48021 RepID=A0ACB8T7X0_9AGAM|nr:hypothetical protein BV25DRAFT_1906569 [Artomyces pyxidatus]
MRYVVRADGDVSESFASGHGVLAGDSASPILWIIFMCDLIFPDDPDDVSLNNVPVSHLEQADDIVLFSLKLRILEAWCAINFLCINVKKSSGMLFGPIPRSRPVLTLLGSPLAWTESYTYVGVTLQSTHRNIFARHYEAKARKGRSVAHVTLGLKSMVGRLPPREGTHLYMARVDPHLIHACDIIPDVDLSLLAQLEAVQVTFLRRLLGLSACSMRAFLSTETGLEPLQYRRIRLLLRFLKYALASTDHLIYHAVQSSLALARAHCPCWISDVVWVASSMATSLQSQLNTSPLALLPNGRPAASPVLRLREYLQVPIPEHRLALTRLVLADHCLAEVRLRWAERYRASVPRDSRLCRFCEECVETPVHALFECVADEQLCVLRREFLADMLFHMPSLREDTVGMSNIEALRHLLQLRKTLPLLARFTHAVLKVFAIRAPALFLNGTLAV